ncbi:MAG: class F sortase, partial [Pseudonocardia sp.]
MYSPSAPGQMGRSGALAGLVAGLALAAVPAGVWAAGAAAPGAAAHTPAVAVAPVAAPVPAPPVTVPAPEVASAQPAPAPPVRVRLPALGVDAPVAPVGVDDRGRMEVPFDVDTVGWYRFGPGPGSAEGSAVLSGHVDDRDQGYGAFHRLGDLAPGDPVAVELGDGGVLGYRVEAVTRMPKSDLPTGEVFDRGGAPRLTLVTCGGPFDYGENGYRENVVVVARPDEP